MQRRLTEITIIILGILIGGLTNVATGVLPDMLPPEWKPYLWLSWLPLGLFIVFVIILEWRASRDGPPAPERNVTIHSTVSVGTANDQTSVRGPTISAPSAREVHVHTTAAAPAPTLHQLRAPVGDFVGRAAEREQLVQTLSSATNAGAAAAISGVRGMGGIGKTELAYAVAQAVAPQFPHAQLLIDLRGASTNPVTPQAALQTLIHAFEREAKLPDDLGELRAIYCSVLAGKRALIIADDARDAAQVHPLLPPPGCALLVTSRQHFALPGMAALDLGALPPDEAAQLLREICPRIAEHAGELAKLCGYLPLALRVSASLLANSSRTVERYLEQLAAARLKHLHDPDDPAAGVEASLRLSYDVLEPALQHALCQLSVFSTSFEAKAALAVVETEADAEAALDTLQRRSLLEWDAATQRYGLHELVRVFAAARLEGAEAAWLRYARHYAQVAHQAEASLLKGGAAMQAGLVLFDQERQHIDAGWAWVRQRAGEQVADELLLYYANATVYVGDLRYDKRRERIPQLEAQRDAAQRLKRRDSEGMALGNLGVAYANLGDPRKAIDFNQQVLIIAREIGDRRGEGASLGNLGNAYRDLGDTRKAIGFYDQQLAITREIGDRRGEGNALGSLGITYHHLGDARKAAEFYEQALLTHRAIGDRRGEGNDLGNLGRIYHLLGDTRKAIELYEQALVILHEIGDRQREALHSWNLGLALEKQGDLARAVQTMQALVNFEREIGHPDAEKHAAHMEQVRRRVAEGSTGNEAQ